MSPAEATNTPRDRNLDKAWESQRHLQGLPPFQVSRAWQVTFWLFVVSCAAAFGSAWATWGGVAR